MKMTILAALVIGLFTAVAWADETLETPATVTATATSETTATNTADATAETAATDAAPATSETSNSDNVGRMKVQTIRVEDRYGTIEEERVPAMRSEVRYVPAGSEEGYNLVSSTNSQGKSQNAHTKQESLMIPSWKMFAW
ncbi:MAG: hypothetical protein RI964_2899 [Pseudomonadota bacterium]|jgi:hypothetical protein